MFVGVTACRMLSKSTANSATLHFQRKGQETKMADLQDRRYFAQCTQHLSSASLASLLDSLLGFYPGEVVERKGGDSYHIDFGTMTEAAFSAAKACIKQALRDDDEVQEAIIREDSLTSLPSLPVSGSGRNGGFTNALELESLVLGKPRESIPVSTPLLAFPTVAPPTNQTIPNPSSGINSISVEPEKSSTRKSKRMRKSESSDDHSTVSGNTNSAPRGSSRYYNGERVLRHESQDQFLTFHGVQVILLGQHFETNRPWKCMVCEKSFVSKDKIMNHIQLHSGEKAHECPVCHERYSSRHYLKEHQKRVHTHDCHQCDLIFPTFEEFHDHTLHEHPQLGEGLCGCTKGCDNSRCSCFKNGLQCSSRCHCKDCRNKAGAGNEN